MLTIDKYAYINNLKHVHPFEKAIFTFIPLLFGLIFNILSLYMFVILSMSLIIVFVARISFKFFLKILCMPLPFIIISIFTIILNVDKSPEAIDYGFRFYTYYIGFTKETMMNGLTIFLRSYSSIMCLYFLSLTTPIIEITWILRKIGVPAIFTEILTIIYRFIFVLLETAMLMKTSQNCRLGYSNYKKSYLSLGLLVSNLFIKAYQNYKMLSLSLVSRGYTGELNVLEESYTYSSKNISLIIIYFIIITVLSIK